MARRMSSRAIAALLVGVGALLAGCSSSTAGTHSPAATPTVTVRTPVGASAPTGSQTYLAAVNRLCDALLPKVIAVTHGGSLDVPVKDYLRQLPAHRRLLADFDRDLARVPVPPSASGPANVLAAYVRFADRLDARRSAAAARGQVAYAKEIRAESSAADDPAITALTAAGFHESCEAR